MLKSKYHTIRPDLQTQLGLKSISAVPKLSKITVNVGVGQALQDSKILDLVVEELKLITGQSPVVTKAKKSIAGFKLREGNPIGAKVTLRGQRMYDFMERLVHFALPRVRDFRGLEPKGFDRQGNYTLGLSEHIAFPEVVFENVDKVFGLEVTIGTTARNAAEAEVLLRALGLPLKNK